MQTPLKVRFWLVTMALSLSAQSQAEEGELPLDMSFLEYLGTMIEDDGQLVDVTEVFAQDIQYIETSPQTEEQYDTSAELPAQPSEARQ